MPVVTVTAAGPANLVGQSETHLCSPEDAELLGARVHRDAIEPFRQLRAAAAAEGFDLAIDSGFRSFERQLSIWNRKAKGQLAVLDSQARPLDISRLTSRDLVFAILRWSALPGASRHHWGTDLDVYDRAAKPEGYEIQLVPAEVEAGGMFAPLHEWLDQRIAAGASFGFFRPYDADRQGVAPERWHLSYAPVAATYLRLLTVDLLRETVERADLRLKDVVLEHLSEIHRRFVININAGQVEA
jgi:LAS superfamily LD-carboxypeptidase LdcB